jgi:hypothetical protein
MVKELLTGATVHGIVNSLPIGDLVACVQDVIAWQEKDKSPGDALRALAARLRVEARLDSVASLEQAGPAVLREAALRLVALQTGLRVDLQD